MREPRSGDPCDPCWSSWFRCSCLSAAFAQAAITGVVRDASGGVLPGVTVEAASPVLIEKVRSVVTDATGQYRIVDLRPGTYSVTVDAAGLHHTSNAKASSCRGTSSRR